MRPSTSTTLFAVAVNASLCGAAHSSLPGSLRLDLGFAQYGQSNGLFTPSTLPGGQQSRTWGVHAQAGTVYVTGDQGLNHSTDGGSTWNYFANDSYRYQMVSVQASGNSIYAAGSSFRYSHDGGASWNTASGLQQGMSWDVWASGNSVYAATDNGVGISNDGGASWTMRYPTQAWGAGITGVRSVTVSNGVIYAGSNQGVCISSDGGITWAIRPLGQDSRCNEVSVIDGAIYAGAVDGLRKSTDGGATWTLTGATAGTAGTQEVHSVFALGNTIYGSWGSQGRNGTFISTNGGVTWNRYSEMSYNIFADESNAYLSFGNSVLIGSAVPAPGALALLGVAGLAAGRRRRN